MSDSDTIPLHPSSQSDIDEIENLIHASVQSGPATVLPARPPSPPRASIPVSSSPIVPSNIPPPPKSSDQKPPSWPAPPPPIRTSDNARPSIASSGFGSPSDTLTEPVWDTVKRDLSRIVNNLKLVVFPNPFREDPGKALRDWDLWGPFFFIVFLGLTLSWSASVKKELCFGTLCDPQDKWFYSLPFSYTLQNTKNWDTVSDGTTWKCERMRKSVSPSFQSVEEASCDALLGFGYRLDLGFVQCLYFILLYFWGRRK